MICGYLDFSAALAQIDNAVASGNDDDAKTFWPRARDASGITSIKHISFGATFDGRDWATSSFVDAPAPRTGLLTVLEPAPIDPTLLARIPSTATQAMLGQFNVGLLLSQARSIAGTVNPAAGDIFDKGLGLAQMMIGRSLQRDILDPLGSQWAIYADASIPPSTITAPQPMMQASNIVVVNKLVDPAKAEQGWTMLSYAITNASAGLIQKNHLPISTAMTKNGDQLVFTVVTPVIQPSWTIKDGFMYFGCSAEGVVDAANKTSGAPITQQPALADLAKQLDPTGSFTGFEYSDLPASIPPSYPAMQAAIDQLRATALLDLSRAQLSIALPEHILPPLEKLIPELSPALNISWADASGWHTRSREPFPGSSPQSSLVSVGGVALGVSILLPSLNRARETANRVKCASNERQIGQACLLFANDHQGKYPANITDMLSEDITPEVFLCPSASTALPANYKSMSPADLGTWLTDHGDYVYVGAGMTSASGAQEVVVYEKPEDHHQGMNILFGDGHVEFDLMPQAVKMIQDQHKTVPGVRLPGVPAAAPSAPGEPPAAPPAGPPTEPPGAPGM
jgi:prepilin-type processing-associated H-X9-DG protein